MKTILITIFHGHIARNILRTEMLKLLTEREDVRIVIAAPEAKKEFYEKEFGGPRVSIGVLPKIQFSKLDKRIRSFYYFFVDTDTVRIIQAEQFLYTKRYVRYAYMRFMTKLFGNIPPLRKLVRFLDVLLVKDTAFAPLFDEYKPDLVVVPSITSDDESLALRQAKARGIRTVGMVRSWDNISVNKGNIRVMPDKLLVHTDILKWELEHFADADPRTVEVVGMSHFDHYFKKAPMSREAFMQKIGGDPKKPLVFVTLIGLSAADLDRHLVSVLEKGIRERADLKDVQLLVRSHPNEDKAVDFVDSTITHVNKPLMVSFPGKLTDREFTPEDIDLLANALYHSAIVINTQSTTTIDAAAFDKPVINVAFDEVPGKPYLKSIRRFYDYTHYLPILASKGVRLAHAESELLDLVALYLKDPNLDHDGRRAMLLEQNGGHADGSASRRTVDAIFSVLP